MLKARIYKAFVRLASLEGGKAVLPTQIIKYWQPYVITRSVCRRPEQLGVTAASQKRPKP